VVTFSGLFHTQFNAAFIHIHCRNLLLFHEKHEQEIKHKLPRAADAAVTIFLH